MQRLTKAEEEIMQVIWRIEPCLVSGVIKELGEPKPPHSTISSIVRILEKKNFVDHKTYGRTHEYFSIVSKADYSKQSIKKLVSDYFGGSMNQLVSFLVKEEKVNLQDLSAMLDQIEEDKTEEL